MTGFPRRLIGGHTQDTIDSATLIAPPAGAKILVVQAIGQAVRYTLDGTTPLTTLGFRIAVGEIRSIALVGEMELNFIEETAGGSIEFQWGA